MTIACLALAKREIRRECSDIGRLLFDAVWPLMVLVVLGFGIDAFAPPKADLSYVTFLGPGVLGLLFLRRTIAVVRSFGRESRLALREYLVTPAHRSWIVMGSLIGSWVVHSVIALVVLGVYTLFIHPTMRGLALAFGGVIISVLASLGIGLLLVVLIENFKAHTTVSFLVLLIMVLVSGIFFPVEILPFSLQFLSYLSPVTYMVESIRQPLAGNSFFRPMAGLMVTVIIAVTSLSIGIWKSKRLFRL